MKTNFKKLAKWFGIIIGVLALLVGGLVLYVWSQLPKAMDNHQSSRQNYFKA